MLPFFTDPTALDALSSTRKAALLATQPLEVEIGTPIFAGFSTAVDNNEVEHLILYLTSLLCTVYRIVTIR